MLGNILRDFEYSLHFCISLWMDNMLRIWKRQPSDILLRVFCHSIFNLLNLAYARIQMNAAIVYCMCLYPCKYTLSLSFYDFTRISNWNYLVALHKKKNYFFVFSMLMFRIIKERYINKLLLTQKIYNKKSGFVLFEMWYSNTLISDKQGIL